MSVYDTENSISYFLNYHVYVGIFCTQKSVQINQQHTFIAIKRSKLILKPKNLQLAAYSFLYHSDITDTNSIVSANRHAYFYHR